MDIEIRTTGPLFTGEAAKAVTQGLHAAEAAVAQAGVNQIHAQLGSVLKNPTGYYESQVVTDISTNGEIITDGGVVYGPWLEGTSSRNETTHFRGYHSFRLVTQRLQHQASTIANRVFAPFINRMN